MAKAQFTTKSGTVITLEGTPDEVAKLISQFEGPESKSTLRGGADMPRGQALVGTESLLSYKP